MSHEVEWELVSISLTFYELLFCTKVFCTAFLYLQFLFVFFWAKKIGVKAARKMLVKLTRVKLNVFKSDGDEKSS